MHTYKKGLPAALTERVETELVGDLRDTHRIGKVLLVGQHEQCCPMQLILKGMFRILALISVCVTSYMEISSLALLDLTQHTVQLIPGFGHPIPVVTVYHEDQPLSVLEVVPPQRSNLHHHE